jgi:hypothetical protein
MLVPHVVRAVEANAGTAREIDTGSSDAIRLNRNSVQPTQK